jgi:hypothetical protein
MHEQQTEQKHYGMTVLSILFHFNVGAVIEVKIRQPTEEERERTVSASEALSKHAAERIEPPMIMIVVQKRLGLLERQRCCGQ